MALIHSLSRGFTIRAAATTVVAARATRARVAPAGPPALLLLACLAASLALIS